MAAVGIDALYKEAHSPTSPISNLYSSADFADSHGGQKLGRAGQAGTLAPHGLGVPDNFDPATLAAMNAEQAQKQAGLGGGTVAQQLADAQAATHRYSQFVDYRQQVDASHDVGGKIALGMALAAAGAAAAPLAAGAVGLAGGGLMGSIAGGAVTGGVTGAANSLLTGSNLGKSVGTGAVLGGIGGGIGNAVGGSPLPGVVKPVISNAASGAVKGVISGAGAGAGALSGAESGAFNAAGNGIYSGAGGLFTPGANPTTTDNGGIPPSLSPGTNNMSVDPSYFDFMDPSSPSYGGSTNVSTTPGYQGDFQPSYMDPGLGPMNDPGASPAGGYLPTDPSGNVGGGSAGGSTLGGLLQRLLGGGGGNGSSGGGLPPGLLQALLGGGLSLGGGVLDSKAAKGAAGTYAGQTHYNPFNINGPNGSTSFNGNTANSTLSPAQQATLGGINGMDASALKSLAAGPGAATTAAFNSLQSGDLQAQQRLLGNTQDNEFANGVLSSTAGGYQTQGALNAIGNQTSQNQVTATNMGNQQQQQQLAQLTAGLNGTNQMSAAQLAQLQAGMSGGYQQSSANQGAYKPALFANSNTPYGNALTNLGNTISNPG